MANAPEMGLSTESAPCFESRVTHGDAVDILASTSRDHAGYGNS